MGSSMSSNENQMKNKVNDSPSHVVISKNYENLKHQPWYKICDRKSAENLLLKMNKNGAFLVRDSKHGGANSPFTLSVLNHGKVFNINIREKHGGLFALGKEKEEENVYSSVQEMIETHRTEALKLSSATISMNSDSSTTLNCWPT